MIEQSKNAVEMMLKAGFSRKEFKVRTYCKNGVYGEALVFCVKQERIIEKLADLLNAGLGVIRYLSQDFDLYTITTSYVFRGMLTENYLVAADRFETKQVTAEEYLARGLIQPTFPVETIKF